MNVPRQNQCTFDKYRGKIEAAEVDSKHNRDRILLNATSCHAVTQIELQFFVLQCTTDDLKCSGPENLVQIIRIKIGIK